ncbi:MAG: hypothetical protein CMM50_17365 [Rhodospirillaceae bacterium]|nr:hypothetical protein [Rhodospirillaceae bacterium]
MTSRLVVRAGHLFTDFGGDDPAPRADAAVLIEHGVVSAIGPAEDLIAANPDVRVIGDRHHVMIPGLINAHSHGRGIDGFRLGVADDWLEAWIPDYMALPPLDPYLDTLLADLMALRAGVTTVIHSAYPRATLPAEESHRRALRAHLDAGVRVAYAPNVQDRYELVYRDTEGFLRELDSDAAGEVKAVLATDGEDPVSGYAAMMARLAADTVGHDRVRLLAGPEGPEWCSEALLTVCGAVMRDLDIGLHTHLLESPIQYAFAAQNFENGAVAYLDGFGLLGPRSSFAHGTWLDGEDRARCAGTGTSVVHNPSSNLRLRNGVAPVAAMLEEGVPLALGMDSTTLDSDEDMWREIRLAHLLHGQPRPEPWAPRPSPADILRAATTGGGAASTFTVPLGRLVEGGPADLVLVDWASVSDPLMVPAAPTAATLVQFTSARHVDTVVVDGTVRLSDGKPVGHDPAAIAAELRGLASNPPPDVARRARAMARINDAVRRDFETRFADLPTEPFYVPNAR